MKEIDLTWFILRKTPYLRELPKKVAAASFATE